MIRQIPPEAATARKSFVRPIPFCGPPFLQERGFNGPINANRLGCVRQRSFRDETRDAAGTSNWNIEDRDSTFHLYGDGNPRSQVGAATRTGSRSGCVLFGLSRDYFESRHGRPPGCPDRRCRGGRGPVAKLCWRADPSADSSNNQTGSQGGLGLDGRTQVARVTGLSEAASPWKRDSSRGRRVAPRGELSDTDAPTFSLAATRERRRRAPGNG